jgi:hypothetical protein
MSGEKKYQASDIQVVSLSEHVLSNPKMYWGTDNPTEDDAIDALVEQLKVLGLDNIKILNSNSWSYVGASFDWLMSGLDTAKSIDNLFKKGWGFPEAGINSLRSEYFIYMFADDVALWRNDELLTIKGACTDLKRSFFLENYDGYVALAFRGNQYL